MPTSTERLVVGGSVAALAAADALAREGARVRLLLPPKGVGGGFAPIAREGRELELGVRLLELEYEGLPDAAPPLRDYVPGPAGHRPFVGRVAGWVRELLGEVREAGTPRMLAGGRVVRDLLFATDPLALRDALSPAERAAAARQAAAARAARGDAGLLGDPDALAFASTAAASRANHGDLVHDRLIGPYADKLVPGGAEAVSATLRRKAWVPLLWPRTVEEACGEGDVAFRAHRPFHHGDGLVGALLARLRAAGVVVEEGVTLTGVAPAGGGRVALRLDGADDREAVRPVLGVSPGELFAAAGTPWTPERCRTAIAWVEAAEDDVLWAPDLLNVVDPEHGVARVSAGGRGAPGTVLLTCELRHDSDPKADGLALARPVLEGAGVVREGAPLELVAGLAAPTFVLPRPEAAASFEAARAAFDALALDCEVVGGASAFGADSLNEQVVQGLRAAEALA